MSPIVPLLLLLGLPSSDSELCTPGAGDDASLLQFEGSTRFASTGQLETLRLRADQMAGLTMGTLDSSEPQHFLFYVPLAENKKHSIESYKSSLGRMCSFISSTKRQNVGLVGDVDAIGSMVSSCGKFTHGHGMKLTDLKYDDVVARIPSDGSCRLKWHPKGPVLQRDVVKIWLNKLPVLCKYAAERPDAVTTLIDANAGSSMLPWANTAALQLQPGKLGVKAYFKTPQHSIWFGNKECNQSLMVYAKYLAVHGSDCPKLMQAYDQVLAATRDHDSGCPCFDEEYLLSRLYEHRPELFQFQGNPR
ncbi:unnamed protein product [Symbiodinium sp. CCMP2456]|nr:unnamed protein product [Symbiodinium sp. CCMP2456]